MKKISFLLIISFLGMQLFSDNISVSGIDSTGLMFDGRVGIYLSITDSEGKPQKDLKSGGLGVFESLDNKEFIEREIVQVLEGSNANKGINFHLLVDNSGSMYFTIDGKETDNDKDMRISSAVSAIRILINSMEGSKDKAGISIFNTRYNELVQIGSNRNLVSESLQKIERPGEDDAFTELNAALYMSSENISSLKGRKIIIVLSDGVNYPFMLDRKEDNPQFGSRLFSIDEVIDSLKQNSATLYGINFGVRKDPALEKAALATGGLLYEADNEAVLGQIYQDIRERVLNEYYLEFKTDTEYAERKFVKTVLVDSKIESGTVYYFSGNLFGSPSENFSVLFLIAFFFSILLLILLSKQKLSDPAEKPGLEITDFSGQTQLFDLEDRRTVIGNSDKDDITLATDGDMEQNNATIIFDEKNSVYTIISEKDVMVNNNPVKTRVLEAGDVISMDGATVIFNDKD